MPRGSGNSKAASTIDAFSLTRPLILALTTDGEMSARFNQMMHDR